MRKVILLALSFCTAWISYGQPTPHYPLTLDGNLEDRIELCSSPDGEVIYFAPFKNKRLYKQNDAAGLHTFTSASSAPSNGLVEMRDASGGLSWSSELISINGEYLQ